MVDWSQLVAGVRQRDSGLGDGSTLRILSAFELVEARWEAEALGGGALWGNACLLARGLERQGVPVFDGAAAVVEGLAVDDIATLCRRWGALMTQWNPTAMDDSATVEQWRRAVAESSYGRLQWRVMRAFGALPTEERVRKMTHRDFLWCGLHLMLDDEAALAMLCPSCRSQVEEGRCPSCGCSTGDGSHNDGFDWTRFVAMRGGVHHD